MPYSHGASTEKYEFIKYYKHIKQLENKSHRGNLEKKQVLVVSILKT